jgi:hypothetical protein
MDAPVAAAPVPPPATSSTVTTTRSRSPWPLYAAAGIVVIAVIALLVVHPWTNDSTANDGDGSSDTVRVRAAAYVGHPVDEVEAALGAKGLHTTTHTIDNPGGHDADTVASLNPTGQVQKGATIALDVWGEPSGNQGKDKGNGQGNGNGQGPDKTKSPKPDQSQAPEPSGGATPAPPSTSADPGAKKGTSGGESAAPNGREKPGKHSVGPKGD